MSVKHLLIVNCEFLFSSQKMVIVCRNGVTVEGATHKQVVDLIRSGGDTLVLTGICCLCQGGYIFISIS